MQSPELQLPFLHTQWKVILLKSSKTSDGQIQRTFCIFFNLHVAFGTPSLGNANSHLQRTPVCPDSPLCTFTCFPILLFFLGPPCKCLRCHTQTSLYCMPQILNPRCRAPHIDTPVETSFLMCFSMQGGFTRFISFSKGYKPQNRATPLNTACSRWVTHPVAPITTHLPWWSPYISMSNPVTSPELQNKKSNCQIMVNSI